METAMLLIGLGLFALVSSKKKASSPDDLTGDEVEIDPDAFSVDGVFPEMERNGTPFDDTDHGWYAGKGPQVESLDPNDFYNPDGALDWYNQSFNEANLTSGKNSLGSPEDGNNPEYVNYDAFVPFADPQAEQREAIAYNTQEYVPPVEVEAAPIVSYAVSSPTAPSTQTVSSPTRYTAPTVSQPVSAPLVQTAQPVVTRQQSYYPQLSQQEPAYTTPILTGLGTFPVRVWGA